MDTLTSKNQPHQKNKYIPVSYTKICQCCGKIFVAHNIRKTYCSRKCKDVDYKRSKGQDSRIEARQNRCIVCGNLFETFNPTKKTCSLICSNEHKKIMNREKLRRKRLESGGMSSDELKKLRKEKADIKRIEKEWQRAWNTEERHCIICGNRFFAEKKNPRKTCSKLCSIENARIKNRIRNDNRLNVDNIIDKDISLEKLYKRDGGICYLCGKLCDYDDYHIDNGIKICGKRYPSVDHVIPLSRGGKHQWENVRLAHLDCNIKKSDTTIEYTKEMSIEHARKMARAKCDNKKKTGQYTLDGRLIRVWESTAQIKRELGFCDTHIQNVCRRYESNTGNAYGYHWEYIDESSF